jgi:Ricin-type beta-trefoil lectin domain/Subtilase family
MGRIVAAVSATGLAVLALTGMAVSAASAAPGQRPSAAARQQHAHRPLEAKLPSNERRMCKLSRRRDQMQCQAIVLLRRTPAGKHQRVFGYGPASLRSAYRLQTASTTGGSGETVALVDAYSDPTAAEDLAVYRQHFHLPACTEASGCLRILNQQGESSPLPPPNAGWAPEESLDMDMVSAICPNCHIVLVEAQNQGLNNLSAAENVAVGSGARFISNSWGYPEFPGQQQFNHDFNHPGDVITVSAGDSGYNPLNFGGASYPATTPYVVSVGGTTLVHTKSGKRHWAESVWGGTGSACSALQPKPSWQRAAVDINAAHGCLNRTSNDVAAVADPGTGVAVYDSFADGDTCGQPWCEFGGTSVSSPLIAAVYALAGNPAPDSYPASYLYAHTKDFFDVTSGGNGLCEPDRQYLCHGEKGYDAPTGWGTPDGISGFSSTGTDPVTVVDPGTQDAVAGAAFQLTLSGLDTGTATSLSYSATGLPSGLTIGSAPSSTNGLITGTLPSTPGSFAVTVTATDTSTGMSATTNFAIVTTQSLAAGSVSAGQVSLDVGGPLNGLCLTGLHGATGTGTPAVVAACGAYSPAQQWQYSLTGAPGGGGTLSLTGPDTCVAAASASSGALATLQPCSGSADQLWSYQSTVAGLSIYGTFEVTTELVNPASGLCLADPGNSPDGGTQLALAACSNADGQTWSLPAGPALSGTPGICLEVNSSGQPVGGSCATDSQDWIVTQGGSIQLAPAGGCLSLGPGFNFSGFDGTAVKLIKGCDPLFHAGDYFLSAPGGQLVNPYTGKCLDYTGTPGAVLRQEDCYGTAGEVWGFN